MIKIKEQIKYLISSGCKKSVIFRKLIRFARKLLYKLRYFKYYLFYKLNNNIILFEAFNGKNYCDSPKAIYEEIIKNKEYNKYKLIWAFKDIEKDRDIKNNEQTIIVKYNSKEYYKYFAQAKYIITNSRFPITIIKKKKQKLIQTWHGTPLKRLGCDIEVDYENPYNTLKGLQKLYEVEAKKMDYLISPSKFTTEKLTSAFNLKKFKKENIVIEQGYPRNDFLLNYKQEDIEKIKIKLNLPKDKKIILYAPTWRDTQHDLKIGYTFNPEIDFDLLKKELEKDYIILYRAHYFIKKTFDFEKYKNFIYDVSDIDDINELYILSDILITDYSSVFFDFANLKKPIIFFMYDLDEYKDKLRGFYLKLEELPGPIVQKEKELAEEIKNINSNKYKGKYENFNKKFNYLDDGQASKRVIEVIIKNG